MSKIRTGVIGTGHLGFHHARLYGEIEGSELIGIVDTDPARAEEVAKEFGVRAFGSVAELIDAGIDAASVSVPTRFHKEVAVELLEGGVDVLVEKPIAHDTTEGRAIIECAERNDRILQIGHVERFNGAVIALMKAITRPRFIECHRLSPYPNRGDDVSVVHDLMIHDIDVVLALDGSEVASIDAVGVPVFSNSEDIANVRLRFTSGCVANITASRISIDRMRKIRIFEDHAYVSTDYSEQEVMVYRKKSGTAAEGSSPMELIEIEALDVRREEPLRLELESFITSVRDRSTPKVTGEDGLRALELAERIVAFSRENR